MAQMNGQNPGFGSWLKAKLSGMRGGMPPINPLMMGGGGPMMKRPGIFSGTPKGTVGPATVTRPGTQNPNWLNPANPSFGGWMRAKTLQGTQGPQKMPAHPDLLRRPGFRPPMGRPGMYL